MGLDEHFMTLPVRAKPATMTLWVVGIYMMRRSCLVSTFVSVGLLGVLRENHTDEKSRNGVVVIAE